MKKINLLIASVLIVVSCKAQLPPGEYTSKNKKAISALESAMKYYKEVNDAKALEEAKKAIGKDSSFVEAYLMAARIYDANKKIIPAISYYTKALEVNPYFDKNAAYFLGDLEYKIGRYESAKKHYEMFLANLRKNPNFQDVAEYNLANCNFAIHAIKNPVPFEPINLGPAINTKLDEYFPAVTADESTFLFTRNNRTQQMPMQEDFLISQKGANDAWTQSRLIGGVNTAGNEGAPCLSADGQLLFFVACADRGGSYGNNRKGLGSCDIFYTQRAGARFTRPYNLGGTVNSHDYETQPSFSADGKSLYFVSRRAGGMGKTDIYVTELTDEGRWTTPKNLGKNINTPETEESVCIHPDGQTLYFATNGRVGMGGLDIYVSRKDANGNWGEPTNLGYPINTGGNENSLLVSASGNLAYFASSRKGGYGGLDLYQFELYEGARPQKITYVKGKVYDAKTKKPLGAHFELLNLATSEKVLVSDANFENGEFLVTLPVGKEYGLNVSQPGYLFYSEHFSLEDLKDVSKPYQMDVPMQPIDLEGTVELKNVFFETAKFDLKPESKVELDKLATFLTQNKTLKIELGGHTDNVGNAAMNQTLSENRAKAVVDYLITKGVETIRLTYKGYGDTQPKVANDTDEHRAMNRRTEFRVVGK